VNILQAACLAMLTASLTRIQIVSADEPWVDRLWKEILNLAIFVCGWHGAIVIERWGWLG